VNEGGPPDTGDGANLFSSRGRGVPQECGVTADQVDQLIFTQISKPSIAIAAERCNVPVEKCHTIMQKWGYTGSACIPMALDDAIEVGKIKRGDLVVMISSGLGWNQAAAAIRMTM
jgi:3-oxoacyl-[acyl-carrier-protein] synthase-3